MAEGDSFYDSDASYGPESEASSGESDTAAGRIFKELHDLLSCPLNEKRGGKTPRNTPEKATNTLSPRPSLDNVEVGFQDSFIQEISRGGGESVPARSNKSSPISTGSSTVVDDLASSIETCPSPTEPKPWTIRECDPGGIQTRMSLSPSSAVVPKSIKQEQYTTSTMVDRIATDVFAPDDTLPRDLSYFRVCPFPDCSVPGCSKVAPIPPASETLRYERSSASTSMVHLTKSTARNDIHISRAHSGGTAVAGFKYRPIRPSTHRINASDRTLNGLISRQICSTQPNKSPPPLTSLTARPTKPRKVVSQPISVAANVVATMENGGRSRGSPIIISAATKPASGPTGTIHDLQRKRNFSSEGTDEVASKNLYDRAAPLMKSDQVSSSDDQSTVQPPPKMPRTISTAKLGAGPGKRSIHNKAKVQINMYIKNKEGLFVLWPFGLLHDKSSEDVCAKIAAEYKRPIGSIVFELIAGGTVTSVEIELSGDEGYQRLDQKVREMVRTCKHGGTIQIIVDPQTPEGADPSWEYDPLQFSEVCLDLMSTCRNRVGALSMNHCGVHSGLGFSTCPQYRKSTALGPQ